MKLFPAMLISITGVVSYIAIQQLVIITLTYTNLIDAVAVRQTSTIGTYTIQIVSDLSAYLICFLIYKFQLGTSKFIRPPHDFLIKEKFKRRNAIIALVTLMAAIFIFFSFYMLMHLRILLLMPLILISFGLVIYLAYRREVRTG
ncbi:hypothetical protein [Paenibacillus chitinolyticus]|uniref:hypothetical protein n=1 Tax=Paenibacillus chitinolyticus TaxID=79263 RepID=UPI003670F951